MTAEKSTTLAAEFTLRQGNFAMDVRFALQHPWTVLFGPSGSGKTTALRTIAGFVKLAAGRIVAFGHEVLVDSGAGVFAPPHLRPVRTAAQGARLFPHITVGANVAFGTGKHAEHAEVVDEVLARFGLRSMTERMPRDLSGGEAQKAAVARAVASAVTGGRTILLLDEPFSGLDFRVRNQLLIELRDWLEVCKIPVLSVTHDVAEAFELGAEVIKIADGKVVQQGPVEVVLPEERARLLGQLRGSGVETAR